MGSFHRNLLPGALLALGVAVALGGCFVEGRCLGGYDCASDERCLGGQCVTCRSAVECTGLYDRNPHSPTYEQSLELMGFRGDVVLVYLANAG